MATYYGIDISRHQGKIDWAAVAKGQKFAFIKATGSDDGLYVDSQFKVNQAGARKAKLRRGYYHFGGGASATAEADYFCKTVGTLQPGEIVVLDAEYKNALNPAWCKQWLDRVQSRLGVKPLIYMSRARLFEKDWSAVSKADYGLWVADYTKTPAENVPLKYWRFYAFHQFTSSGKVAGVTGNVDRDAFFAASITVFDKYGKAAPKPVPAPKPAPAPKPEPKPQVIVPAPVPAPEPAPAKEDEVLTTVKANNALLQEILKRVGTIWALVMNLFKRLKP
jgi:lysozyme